MRNGRGEAMRAIEPDDLIVGFLLEFGTSVIPRDKLYGNDWYMSHQGDVDGPQTAVDNDYGKGAFLIGLDDNGDRTVQLTEKGVRSIGELK